MTIPARATHTFCNASSTEELVIEFVLEPRFRERDEAFFREFRSISFSFRLLMRYRECTVLSR